MKKVKNKQGKKVSREMKAKSAALKASASRHPSVAKQPTGVIAKSTRNEAISKTIHVKNAEGDPDTVAEILIQNKIDYTPKVSVVMPVYNVEPYLRQCLDSVINQTLKEIEIICVDDGSTDASLDILKEYAKKDKRITVIAPGHVGTGHCRNIALSLVKGEWIGFVDPDDWIEEEYFEKLYTSATDDTDIVFQTSRIETYWKEGKEVVIDTPKGSNDYVFKFNTIHYSAHLWSKIFRRSFVEKYNLKNSFTKRSQDLLFTFPALLLAKNIKCINHAKYFYRKGQKSACTVEYVEQDAKEVFALYKQIESKVAEFNENMLSLVKYKKNITLKKMYTTSSEDVQQIIRDNAKDLYEVDFDLYGNSENKKIAIKSPSPDSVDKLWWGDYWLGLDLAQGLKEQGYDVRTDCGQDFEKLGNQDINFVIRGPRMFKSFDNKKLNVMYLMSRSQDISNDELDMYDVIIVASKKHARRLKHRGYKNIYYLPQFTNANRFFYEKDKEYQNDVLFVGNAYHNTFRPAVKYAVENNITISIYGKFWEEIVDNCLIKGLYVDNNDLHKYYSNAKIVLNDTNEDMRINGFVSNRIHDATACKAFVISDYMPEIKELYGDSIPMYRNKEEYGKLIKYYLAHPKEREEKALKAYEITKKLYTNQKFAQDVKNIINKSKKITHNSVKFYENILKNFYFNLKHKHINLASPHTFNEKIQWLKLYNAIPIKTRLADKYLVRDWVKEKIGEKYLIPLLGVYNNFDEINFDKLPNQFVIKCNHGSGYNIIVKNKSELDLKDTENKLNQWMSENFAFKNDMIELQYRDITPKIVIEKFIINNASEDLFDYKFYCFNGIPVYCQFIWGRNGHDLKMSFYDMNWKKQSFYNNNQFDPSFIPRPTSFQKMKELASSLAKGFGFVRVDFYQLDNGDIYFGEMTFSPASGIMQWNSERVNLQLGEMIKLPSKAYNIDTKEYYTLPKPNKIKPYLLFPYYLYKNWQIEKSYQDKLISIIKSQLCNFRIDIKNFGIDTNALEITSKNCKITQPKWSTNTLGIGNVIEGKQLKNTFKIKAINDGIIKISFKSIDKKVGGEKIPLWIDYKSIKIDGKELLSAPISVWHDKPYRYEMTVKDGQEISLEIEQQYHEYLDDELRDLLLNLYSDNRYIQNNIDEIMLELKKQYPIIDIVTKNKRELENKISEILSSLTSYRLDIKNYGIESNDIEVVTNNAVIREEKWFTNEYGVGKILQGNTIRNIIKLIIINNGKLRIDFKGIDKKFKGKKIPFWIDYKSIKIDGKEILTTPIATWHGKPYKYEMPVKDKQVVTVEFEQQYHQYSEEELKDVIREPSDSSNKSEILKELFEFIKKDDKNYNKYKYLFQKLFNNSDSTIYAPQGYYSFKPDYQLKRCLETETVNDGIIVPSKTGGEFWRQYHEDGFVLDKSGYICMVSSYSPNPVLSRKKYTEKIVCDKIIHKKVIFIGCFHVHFGHFILEGLARLWYLLEKTNSEYDLAYVADAPLPAYITNLLSLLGLDSDKLLKIEEPTKFDEIIVPELSFCIENACFWTEEYRDIIRRIKKNIKPSNVSKIYLSRLHFKDNILGESEIERIFEDNGYTIIYPEKLSIQEQISIISGARDIATICGSSAHNLVFANKNAKCTILERANKPNQIQMAINQMNSLKSSYVMANFSFLPTSINIGPYLMGLTSYFQTYLKKRKFCLKRSQSDSCFKFITTYLYVWITEYSEKNRFNDILKQNKNISADKLNWLLSQIGKKLSIKKDRIEMVSDKELITLVRIKKKIKLISQKDG